MKSIKRNQQIRCSYHADSNPSSVRDLLSKIYMVMQSFALTLKQFFLSGPVQLYVTQWQKTHGIRLLADQGHQRNEESSVSIIFFQHLVIRKSTISLFNFTVHVNFI